ncbi:MAG TPA: carboxypeptidase-like regulatory domain-containing protein [Bryobacteraceae bacterium]|nr:hypothetical protein [Bryobacterales bacterium]HRJ20317.1 carboxypeptidase-like regulatory domain-containing protein [Bryobacteraceae bacterium]
MRLWIFLVIFCGPSWACSCGGYPPVKEAWLGSPVVFVGIVEKARFKEEASAEQSAWVRVKEAFKGVQNDEVLELQGGRMTSCSQVYAEGQTLLFYLYPSRQSGVWYAPPCHRTAPPQWAADDLRFLRGLPDTAEGNRVSGVVRLQEDDLTIGAFRSRGLAGVRVRARGDAGVIESTTDPEGVYEFRQLAPGDYKFTIDPPEKTRLSYPVVSGRVAAGDDGESGNEAGVRLEVTETSGSGIDYTLTPDTRIAGRVLGPDGGPMAGVCLRLEPVQGRFAHGSSPSSCSDSDGGYSIERIAPGTYRLVANRDGVPSASEPFGRLYYPGTSEQEKAGVLNVAGGQHLEGIDLRVPELVRRIQLRGRLVFSDGVPLAEQSISFLGLDGRGGRGSRTDGRGSFVVQILAGRAGQLTGHLTLWSGLESACPQFAEALGENRRELRLESKPTLVSGTEDLSGIEVVFPFPSCEAWVQKDRAMKAR